MDKETRGPDSIDQLGRRIEAVVRDAAARIDAAARDAEPHVDRFIREVQPRLDGLLALLQKSVDDLRRDLDERAKRASGPPSGHIAADIGSAEDPHDPPPGSPTP